MAAIAAKQQAKRWPSSRGYHATTTRDVAEAADVTPGAGYFHVPTKRALLVAVYAEGGEQITGHSAFGVSFDG